MKCKITPELSSKDWKEFCSRFHFDNDKLPLIRAIYTAMLPLVDAFAYYSIKQDLPGVSLTHYAYGLVTLGNGADELSELYLNHEQLEEAYIADCLSLMLLSNAYEQFAKAVEEESSLYAIELSFLGDEYPLELLPEIFEHVSPDGIHLTGSNMLMPLKTAALIISLAHKSRKISKSSVIPARTVKICRVHQERPLVLSCHTPMVPCRFSISDIEALLFLV